LRKPLRPLRLDTSFDDHLSWNVKDDLLRAVRRFADRALI
jgi:hypothetical protein